MCSFQKLFIFIFSFFSFQDLVTSVEDNCPVSSCGENSIQYPFSIVKDNNQGKQFRKDCVYPPGFDLSCRNQNETILKLPVSGEFYVRDINYFTQKIQVSDPNECLPRRYLQNISVSGTPFVSESFQSFIFWNCSTESYSNLTSKHGNVSIPFLHQIDCLSSSTHIVLATDAKNVSVIHSMNTSRCELFDNDVIALTQSDWSSKGKFYALTVKDLYLRWDLPEKQRRDLSKGVLSLLIIGAGLPLFIGVLWCCRYGFTGYGYDDRNNQTHTELSTSGRGRNGLDESTIQSYPQIILSESRRFLNPENTVCSICLADYKPKDTLKSLPDCNHYFHAKCIDEWLRKNGSCPVCRKSPHQSPPLTVPPA